MLKNCESRRRSVQAEWSSRHGIRPCAEHGASNRGELAPVADVFNQFFRGAFAHQGIVDDRNTVVRTELRLLCRGDHIALGFEDRKSAVWGRSVQVGVCLGGSREMKK